MSYFYRFSLIFGLMSQWIGCTISDVNQSSEPVKLSVTERIKVGKTTKTQVIALLGDPDHVTDFEKLPHVDETGINWGYDEGNYYERLSLFFEKGSDVVSSILWDVREKDPESSLKKALARYRGAKWKSRSQRQDNPHVTPTKCYFEDLKKGISIEYSRTRKEVDHIAWWDPNRTPANERKKKAVNCIGGKCHEYDSSVLTWQEPPCEIPTY